MRIPRQPKRTQTHTYRETTSVKPEEEVASSTSKVTQKEIEGIFSGGVVMRTHKSNNLVEFGEDLSVVGSKDKGTYKLDDQNGSKNSSVRLNIDRLIRQLNL